MYRYKIYFSLYLAGEIISRGMTRIINADSEEQAKEKLQLKYRNIEVFIYMIKLLWPDE